jgi:hypothetical protein
LEQEDIFRLEVESKSFHDSSVAVANWMNQGLQLPLLRFSLTISIYEYTWISHSEKAHPECLSYERVV